SRIVLSMFAYSARGVATSTGCVQRFGDASSTTRAATSGDRLVAPPLAILSEINFVVCKKNQLLCYLCAISNCYRTRDRIPLILQLIVTWSAPRRQKAGCLQGRRENGKRRQGGSDRWQGRTASRPDHRHRRRHLGDQGRRLRAVRPASGLGSGTQSLPVGGRRIGDAVPAPDLGGLRYGVARAGQDGREPRGAHGGDR